MYRRLPALAWAARGEWWLKRAFRAAPAASLGVPTQPSGEKEDIRPPENNPTEDGPQAGHALWAIHLRAEGAIAHCKGRRHVRVVTGARERRQSLGAPSRCPAWPASRAPSAWAFLSPPSPLPPKLDLWLLPEFSRICQSWAELRYSTFYPLEGTRCFPSVGWTAQAGVRIRKASTGPQDWPGQSAAAGRECSVPSWSEPAHLLLLESPRDTQGHD
ncbi:unnamed protein product [Rangifer tarandus platyrhynchus]|uniref:Uncharacterized protein n=1 Tax=Rangifer tarandus platyrhynchus TaxID=3082113 RepID=A0AC59ZKV3_RANTA